MSCNGFQDREADVGRLFPGVDSQNGSLKDESTMTDTGRVPLGYLWRTRVWWTRDVTGLIMVAISYNNSYNNDNLHQIRCMSIPPKTQKCSKFCVLGYKLSFSTFCPTYLVGPLRRVSAAVVSKYFLDIRRSMED